MRVTASGFRERRTLQAMPVVAMVLVVMLLAVLLGLLHRNEVEEANLNLIKDILWVEQNIHFHLTSSEEKLTQMAAGLERSAHPVQDFSVTAQQLVTTNPGIVRIILRDPTGDVSAAWPPFLPESSRLAESQGFWADTFRLAQTLGRPSWTGAFPLSPGAVVQAHVPIYRDKTFLGMVVGEFSLDSILTHHVPWWVAEKYKIEIVDSGGTVLAAKTQVTLAEPGPSHAVRLEPPGQGIQVVATVYAAETNLARNMLAAAIFGLTVLSATSLWALRRHVLGRLAAEQALSEQHAFRKAMEDSLTVGMRARDRSGRITYVNPAFCRMVGWSAAELVGLEPPMPYWCPEILEETMEMHHKVMAGAAPADGFEILFRRKDGEKFWALVYEAPLIDASGRHTGWMASVLDLTERKNAEEMARLQQEKLQRTGRLITMGEMASTLAHELNQPLSAIASYNAGCLNRLETGKFDAGDFKAALTKLGIQAQRAGQIIRRVHDFVRKSEPQMGTCSIHQVIEDTVGFIELDAKRKKCQIELSLSDGDQQVHADRIQVEQVLLNLARNGLEAMAATPADLRKLTITLRPDADYVTIEVADRGGGVPPDMADNLFQPFFTTKEDGMGMGLNICRSIIEIHRGRLWFTPNPLGGSVFSFTLPLRIP